MIIPYIWENQKWQPNHQPDNIVHREGDGKSWDFGDFDTPKKTMAVRRSKTRPIFSLGQETLMNQPRNPLKLQSKVAHFPQWRVVAGTCWKNHLPVVSHKAVAEVSE